MNPSTIVWTLGVLALASLVQVAGLAVMGIRVLSTWRRLQATTARVTADLGVVRQNVSAATQGFVAAGVAGRAAVASARPIVSTARNVGWLVSLARSVGLGRAATAARVLSMLLQRG